MKLDTARIKCLRVGQEMEIKCYKSLNCIGLELIVFSLLHRSLLFDIIVIIDIFSLKVSLNMSTNGHVKI